MPPANASPPPPRRLESVAEEDLTCLRFLRVNELLFVYLGLVYASLMRPVSSLSVFYFLCLLLATPLYFYSRWFTVRARKWACMGLFVLSISALVIQTVMVTYWLCTHSKQAEGVLKGVLGERHVSFFLFSFFTRDIVVAATSGLAAAALRSKEAQLMTHRETPVRLLPTDSLVAKYWHMACMVLMTLAGVIFPSALSMPYYIAYLLTASSWSLEYFAGEEGQTFQRRWESSLAKIGVLYTLAYLVLIYIFQIPGAAWSTDVVALQRVGVINLSELEDDVDRILPVFLLHTGALFLLYSLASSVITADLLEARSKSDATDPASSATTVSDVVGPLSGDGSNHITWSGFDPSGSNLSPRGRISYRQQVEEAERHQQQQQAALLASQHQNVQHPWVVIAEKLVAYYGMYLCFVVYVVLALRRPTILGFVFMVIVSVGATLPEVIFRLCAPLLLMYTACYSTAVYWFGAVIGREGIGGIPEMEELVSVGLPPIDPFDGGWLHAFIPLLMTTVLGLAWRYRSQDPTKPSEDFFTVMWGNPEWKKYLMRYLASYDATLYVCLLLSFIVGFGDKIDGQRLPFVLLGCFLLAFPGLARYAWPVLVLYTQGFILYEYWERFAAAEHHHPSPRPFYAALAMPVALFILSCRQLASFYAKQWRFTRTPSRASDETANGENGVPADGSSVQGEGSTDTITAELILIQKMAARRVNLVLYLTKQACRLAIVCLLWHMAFRTPLNIFAVGYLLLLAVFPVLFVWSTSYTSISRDALPVLFRFISLYCAVVICLIYIFLADNLTGISVDRHIGRDLKSYGAYRDDVRLTDHTVVVAGFYTTGHSFIVMNWVLQMLCATQTEVLRNQVMDLQSQTKAYPRLVHSIKQVLPFLLLTVIFSVVWEYVSFFGACLLYLAIVNAILGRKVEAVWRIMLLSSITISVLIVLFDLAAFSKFASPTLFWLGLRRGTYVPNPDLPGKPLEEVLSGWQLSPSAERYMIIAFTAALQYFYNTGKDGDNKGKRAGREDDEEEAADEGDSTSSTRHLPVSLDRSHMGVSSSKATPECARRGSIIDNTKAVAPMFTSILEALYQGTWGATQDGGQADHEEQDEDLATAAADGVAKKSSSGRRPLSVRDKAHMRLGIVQHCLWSMYQVLHYLVRSLLATFMKFSFEACVIYVVVAAVVHADLVSLLYLALFVLLVTRPRDLLEQKWKTVVHAMAVLVMAEYLVVLRLPPRSMEHSKGHVVQIMGSRQCSLFAQYAEIEEHQYPYSYGQWLGLCITDSTLLLVDFAMLLLTIVQSKRFKADKLSIEKPLFSRLVFKPSNPELISAEPDFSMDLGHYVVLRYGAYVTIFVIFILSTLTFNLVSLGYLILVGAIVGNHPQEGLFTKRRYLWAAIACYAGASLFMRVFYQLPGFRPNYGTGSIQAVLGLRKVYEGAFDEPETPPEMIFDAVILLLVVIQRRIFLSPSFQKIIDELWYAESFEYAANGFHVVNQLEKIREEAMVTIRRQITTMHEHLETLSDARKKVQDDQTWELFLLKNRNAALAATGAAAEGAEAATGGDEGVPPSNEDEQFKQPSQEEEPSLSAQPTSTSSGTDDDLVLTPSLAGDQPSLISQSRGESMGSISSVGATSYDGTAVGGGSSNDRSSSQSEASASHRPQWSNVSSMSTAARPEGSGSKKGSRAGSGDAAGGSTTPTKRGMSVAVYEEVTHGLHEAGEGLNAITNWVSASIHQVHILELKDPLLASKELVLPDGTRSRGRSTASTFSNTKARGMSLAHHDFLPPPHIMEEDPTSEDNQAVAGGGGPDTDLASARSTSSPPPIPLEVEYHHHHMAAHAAGKKQALPSRERGLSRLELLLVEKVEEPHGQSNEIRRHAQRMALKIFQNALLFLNSRSTSMVYSVLVFAHMYQPSLLSLLYPISVFGYALLQNPRSLPQIGGSLLHPMVQNPPREFWNFLLFYSFTMLLIKFLFQFPLFCICSNSYSWGSHCPSTLLAFADVCPAESTPRLDYYIQQPVVHDYAIGIYKAFKSLPWNQMSLRYEPVNRFTPATPPGTTSDDILDSGLHGAFLVSLLGDVMVLFSVLWHAHVLKMRGVWLCRDPEAVEGEDGDAGRHARTKAAPSSAVKAQGRGDDGDDDAVDLEKQDQPTRKRKTHAAAAGGESCGFDDDEPATTTHKSVSISLKKEEAEEDVTKDTRGRAKVGRQQSLEDHVGALRSLARRGFKEYCQVFMLSAERRAKPGVDLYVYLFFLQCFLFLFVLLAYQQAEHLLQSVKENQLSGGFIVVLLLHFVVIVVDRCIYLYRSVKGKTILQMCLILAVYTLIHSNFTFRMGINQHGPLFAWYLIMCIYFFLSALQIGYGYPPFIETNWLTKRVHHAWGNVFRIYRAIPFLYELRMLLDWTCTPTTLYLGEWIKLEDIFSGLYIGACNLHFMECEQRRKGQPQPFCRKWGTGFLFFALLNLLVWLPLFIFSTGSLSNYDNFVTAASMTVQVNGFPTLYRASTADYISPILPSNTWSRLAQGNSALRLLPATSTNDYMRELQFVRMPSSSQEVWQISPPAQRELLSTLQDPTSNVDLTTNFVFKTQDGASNEGAAVHRLSAEEKAQLADAIVRNRTDVRLQGLLPSVIRVSASKEVTPLLAADDARPDCLFTFKEETNGTDLGWWELTCAASMSSCGSTDAVPDQPSNTNDTSECEPSLFTISSQKTIGSFVTFGYGIIGLYFTVVFTIGRFVHMSVMGMKSNIMYDDLPRVQVLYELCTTIYLARMYRNLKLEEELYRELIDIYRRPQMIYERTGPYRHWLVKDDDGASAASYLQGVEEELKKYK